MTNASPDQRDLKQEQEEQISSDIEQELTDEQLVQLAEGSSSWGANCNKAC